MYKESKLVFLYCETSLHAGAGNGLGRIDLPIQREGHTGFPKIESSGLKGSIREVFEENPAFAPKPHPVINVLFGNEDSQNSGALGFTDARILLFPVRSAKGIFAWVTCPRVLQQLQKDYALLRPAQPFSLTPNNLTVNDGEIIAGADLIQQVGGQSQVMLEEFVFTNTSQNINVNGVNLAKWLGDKLFDVPVQGATTPADPFHSLLQSHFAIVSNDAFTHFVKLFTEVVTRNKIDNDTGIVHQGALFTEEYLPCNTVLYTIVMASDEFDKPSKPGYKNAYANITDFKTHFDTNTYFQAGGNATIGKGILKVRYN
jgi:CRISPR-associated protein Cmr4